MKNLFNLQGIAAVLRNRFVRTTALPLCLFVLSALKAAPAYAGDPPSVYSKHQDLRVEGSLVGAKQDINGLNFDARKWTYCIITLDGFYQKDITHRPSQKFYVQLNGRQIFNEDLKGHRELVFPMNGTEQRIDVTGYMQCVNAATHMAGKVTVDCFLEEPGAFYITQTTYDETNATVLKDEFIEADKKIIFNDSELSTDETVTLSWTETKTLTWQKTFSHTESVKVSLGFKGVLGGFEAMTELNALFRTDYQEGNSDVTSKTFTSTSKVTVPPHTRHEVYLEKVKSGYLIPYILEGYVLNRDGSRTPKTIRDKCVFTYITTVVVKHREIGSKEEPRILEVIRREGPLK